MNATFKIVLFSKETSSISITAVGSISILEQKMFF